MALVLAFAELAGMILLLTAGITDTSLADVFTGKALAEYRRSSTATGAAGGGSSSAGGSSAPPAGSSGKVVGAVTRAMLETIGLAHGWTGSQIDAWMNVINRESGGNPNAVNSSSGAYGIGQMLAPGGSPSNLAPNKAKYSAYGGNAATIIGQLTGMAGYIAQRYGTPAAAWAHEQSAGWY